MRVEWDEPKNATNQRKHGISFEIASQLFTSGVDYLEIFDARHSHDEDRFICIGPIDRGVVVGRTGRRRHSYHFREMGHKTGAGALRDTRPRTDNMTDIPELDESDFARAIPASLKRRLIKGDFRSGEDIAALRMFTGLTQQQFATAMGISVHTLRNWEQGRRRPEGPAISLLRIAARHPRILRENLESAA